MRVGHDPLQLLAEAERGREPQHTLLPVPDADRGDAGDNRAARGREVGRGRRDVGLDHLVGLSGPAHPHEVPPDASVLQPSMPPSAAAQRAASPCRAPVPQVTMRPMSLVGIDIGSSAVKAAAYDADGALLAQATEAVPSLHPGPGLAEVDGDGVWKAVVTA